MELQDVVDAVARELGLPGVAVGVLCGDERAIACAGVTNVEHPLDIDASTLFQVGSITKTFTTAAMMLLVERGDVALEDPVGRHLPWLEEETGLAASEITLEHLLSHQAGFDGDHLMVHRESRSFASLTDARRLFAPGTGCSYNNAAFCLAGAVIEAVSGRALCRLRPRAPPPAARDDDRLLHRRRRHHAPSRRSPCRVRPRRTHGGARPRLAGWLGAERDRASRRVA